MRRLRIGAGLVGVGALIAAMVTDEIVFSFAAVLCVLVMGFALWGEREQRRPSSAAAASSPTTLSRLERLGHVLILLGVFLMPIPRRSADQLGDFAAPLFFLLVASVSVGSGMIWADDLADARPAGRVLIVGIPGLVVGGALIAAMLTGERAWFVLAAFTALAIAVALWHGRARITRP